MSGEIHGVEGHAPMIPLRDASRTPVRFPVVTVSLIAVSVLAFVWEVGNDEAAIIRWAVVPAELLRGCSPAQRWLGQRLAGSKLKKPP